MLSHLCVGLKRSIANAVILAWLSVIGSSLVHAQDSLGMLPQIVARSNPAPPHATYELCVAAKNEITGESRTVRICDSDPDALLDCAKQHLAAELGCDVSDLTVTSSGPCVGSGMLECSSCIQEFSLGRTVRPDGVEKRMAPRDWIQPWKVRMNCCLCNGSSIWVSGYGNTCEGAYLDAKRQSEAVASFGYHTKIRCLRWCIERQACDCCAMRRTR